MRYRSEQKLKIIEQDLSQSLEDPIEFLYQFIFTNSMDLWKKSEESPVYAKSFEILMRKSTDEENRVGVVYTDFIHRLANYWKEHGAVREVDEQGLVNTFTGSFLLFANAIQFDQAYFERILKNFILNLLHEFIQ